TSRNDLRRQLVTLAMHRDLQRFTDAEDHLEILVNADPGNGELKYLVAQCLEANKEFAEAVRCYQEAIAAGAPGEIEAYAASARLTRQRLNRGDDADHLIEEMVQRHGDDYRAYVARARYRKELDRLDKADEDLARARQLAADQAEVLLESADLARRGDNLA